MNQAWGYGNGASRRDGQEGGGGPMWMSRSVCLWRVEVLPVGSVPGLLRDNPAAVSFFHRDLPALAHLEDVLEGEERGA